MRRRRRWRDERKCEGMPLLPAGMGTQEMPESHAVFVFVNLDVCLQYFGFTLLKALLSLGFCPAVRGGGRRAWRGLQSHAV